MNEQTRADWRWADKFFNSISQILKENFGKNVTVTIAPSELDLEQATDYLLDMDNKHIACRMREIKYFNNPRFRDFTIRSRRPTNAKTEWAKIKEGFGDYYFYGWGTVPKVAKYMIIDLHKFRASGLIENQERLDKEKHEKKNPQETRFRAIKPIWLDLKDCILYKNF